VGNMNLQPVYERITGMIIETDRAKGVQKYNADKH